MGYYNDRDSERQQYENWRQYGRERGFFDRATDEIRSWFGDEDAEHRRQMDQQMEHVRGEGRGRGSGVPEWQRRGYSGSSPRGSRIEERGRYDEPTSGRSRRFQREDGGAFGGRNRSWGRRYENEQYGRQPWDSSRQFNEYGESRFWGDRDMESGMPYGRQYNEGRGSEGYGRGWGQREERGESGTFGYGRPQEQGMSGFRGRGPRNYRRNDERLSDEINEQLTMHPEIDATDIEVIVENGVVTLRGSVNSRYSKRASEDIAEDVYGVREVHNELRIERPGTNNQDREQFGRTNALSR